MSGAGGSSNGSPAIKKGHSSSSLINNNNNHHHGIAGAGITIVIHKTSQVFFALQEVRIFVLPYT
jgi:hypothetical protein